MEDSIERELASLEEETNNPNADEAKEEVEELTEESTEIEEKEEEKKEDKQKSKENNKTPGEKDGSIGGKQEQEDDIEKEIAQLKEETKEEPKAKKKETNNPVIKINSLPKKVDNLNLIVRGSVSDDSGVAIVLMQGEKVKVTSDGRFVGKIKLGYGQNNIKIQAEDVNGNVSEKIFKINASNI